jgi:hypothetical protein
LVDVKAPGHSLGTHNQVKHHQMHPSFAMKHADEILGSIAVNWWSISPTPTASALIEAT